MEDFAVFDDLIGKEKRAADDEEEIYEVSNTFNPALFKSKASGSVIGCCSGEAHAQGKRATMEDTSCMLNALAIPNPPNGGNSPREKGGGSFAFFSIYDGHNGNGTSDYLAERLHIEVASAVGELDEVCLDHLIICRRCVYNMKMLPTLRCMCMFRLMRLRKQWRHPSKSLIKRWVYRDKSSLEIIPLTRHHPYLSSPTDFVNPRR